MIYLNAIKENQMVNLPLMGSLTTFKQNVSIECGQFTLCRLQLQFLS